MKSSGYPYSCVYAVVAAYAVVVCPLEMKQIFINKVDSSLHVYNFSYYHAAEEHINTF